MVFQGLSLLPDFHRTNSNRPGSALQPGSATPASQPRGAQKGMLPGSKLPAASIQIKQPVCSAYLQYYSWRENVFRLTRLTKTLTVLCKIEHVYFSKAIHYKVRNQTAKSKFSRVLPGYFGISCRKSFSLSQSFNSETKLYSPLTWHAPTLFFLSSADNRLDKQLTFSVGSSF